MMTPERIAALPPHPASEREKFVRGFNAGFRRMASGEQFKYRPGNKDTRSPSRTARRIKAAVEDDTPLLIRHDIEGSIFALVLCAGNPVSLDAPLDAQYLAAYQRAADYHAGRVLVTPEELARFGAMVFVSQAVEQAVAAYDLWKKGRAK